MVFYYSKLDTEKKYGWDLNNSECPPIPSGKNYKEAWEYAKTKTRKSRIDDYAQYMTKCEKGAAEPDAEIPKFVQVEGRVSIGMAVFTIDCELSLWLEGQPQIVQIKYKREDHANAPDICHEFLDRDIVEMKLFQYNDPNQISKGKIKTYLGLRANITDENGLRQYYGGIYSPAPKSERGRRSDKRLSYKNYITFEIASFVDGSASEFKSALMSSKFRASNHIGAPMKETDLQVLTEAFSRHSLSSENEGIDVYASRISIGKKTYDIECNISFQPDFGYPKISLSYFHRMEQISHIFSSANITHLYCTPAKLPPAPGEINYYIVLEVWPDDENGLDPFEDEHGEEDATNIVIEICEESDFQELSVALSLNKIFAIASQNKGLKAPHKNTLMKDLAPIIRDNNRKAKLRNSRYLLAEPPYFEQSRRECFVCNRIYPYYSDEPVVMAPCCGTLCCIDCFDDKFLAEEACQCGATITTDHLEIEKLIRERSETEPYAQYVLGTYIIGSAPAFDTTAFIEGEYDDGIELIRKAAQNKFVPACRMMALFYTKNSYYKSFQKDLDKAISVLLSVKDSGDPLVSFDLAKIYKEKGDRLKYIKYLRMASDAGHGEARGMLGRLYWGSKLKSKDEIKEFFLFAVAYSEPKCRRRYYYHLASLSREQGDYKKYIEWLRLASKHGHCEASYEMGVYNLLGRFCAFDRHLARQYLEQSCSQWNGKYQEGTFKFAQDVLARHFENRHVGINI